MKFPKFLRKFCYISLNIRKLHSMSRKETTESTTESLALLKLPFNQVPLAHRMLV